MMPDGYPPAPLVGLARRSPPVTSRVDVGTTVFLLPFYNPVQVAEHAAMVDVISGGRMILGVGIGNFEPEFELFGRTDARPGAALRGGASRSCARSGPARRSTTRASTSRPRGASARCRRTRRLWMGAMSESPACAARRGSAPVADRPAAQHPRDQRVGRRSTGPRARSSARPTSSRSRSCATAGSPTTSTRSSATGGPRSARSTGSTSPRSRAGSRTASPSCRGSSRRGLQASRTTASTGWSSAAPRTASTRSAPSRTRSATTT